MSTDQIIADAAEAKARDAGEVTTPVIAFDPLLDIPRWLLRELSQEDRDQAWLEYCVEHGIQPTELRAPACELGSREILRVGNLPPDMVRDLRAVSDKLKTEKRIAKMKAGQERKRLTKAGALREMPLTGKDALAKIKGEDT